MKRANKNRLGPLSPLRPLSRLSQLHYSASPPFEPLTFTEAVSQQFIEKAIKFAEGELTRFDTRAFSQDC